MSAHRCPHCTRTLAATEALEEALRRETCHTAMFSLEQCREAWTALTGVSYREIRDWAKFGDGRKPSTKARAA